MSHDRRELFAGSVMLAVAMLLPRVGVATPSDVAQSIDETFGIRPHEPGPVTITIPPLAETGNSVPLTATVDNPMTETNRILRLALFAENNPRPKLAEARFGPMAAQAVLSTNIRLNGSQKVICIAERSDGILLRAEAEVRVVVGACTTLNARY